MRLHTLDAPGAMQPLVQISQLRRGDIRAAMERVADRLIADGVPREMALEMAYESMLRIAKRQQRRGG